MAYVTEENLERVAEDIKGNIVNNLLDGGPQKFLSAEMGAQLKTMIAYFRNADGQSNVFTNDINTILWNSIYCCENATHTPELHGTLFTVIGGDSATYGSQLFISDENNGYFRALKNSEWSEWKAIVTEGQLITLHPTMPDSNTSVHRDCHYVVQGNHVHVDFAFMIKNARTGFANRKEIITGIPLEYCPAVDLDVICSNGADTGYTIANLMTTGIIRVYAQTTGTTYAIGSFEYFV